MQARSILMNWKQTRRTENIVDRSTVMPTKTSVPSNSLSKRFPQDPWGVSVTQDRLSRLSQHITERTEAMHNMKKLILSVFIFTFGFATATHAQQVNTLLTKKLPEAPGKEIEVITVNYAPGTVDTIHRHDAHAVVYVLEGEVEMQVRGGMLQRLGPGQVFYESPEDVHTVSRNASKTKPAKFVVFFIKNEGAPILTPVH